MIGYCRFCGQINELTNHHKIAKVYDGTDNPNNLIPNTCRQCHDELEEQMNKNRGLMGAGLYVEERKFFNIGTVPLINVNGSAYLSSDGTIGLNVGHDFLGMRCHLQNTGQNNISLNQSGGTVAIVGSPTDQWVFYSYVKRNDICNE